MPIKPTQTIPNLQQKIEDKYLKACVLNLKYVGEQCIRDARLKGSYTDRTGNLRSSIGYVIAHRGNVLLESAFNTVNNGSDGTKGGKNYAHQLAQQYSSGLVLIVVAGMNYASYVQRRGYNVTASAELIAEQLVNQMLPNAKVEHVL
ncbi:MAG: hypothetical protein IJU90_05675 [Bacteroidales bacterium]|nr:hypothetical protein [Bacteroidales bacterium]